MDIMILCAGALIATLAAWMYLNIQQPHAMHLNSEGNEDDSANEANSVEKAEEKLLRESKLLACPTVKRTTFLVFMFLSLCGMSVLLETTFEGNSIIDNSKLLILLAMLFVAANVDSRQRIIPNALLLAALILRIVFWLIELFAKTDLFMSTIKSELMACLLVIIFCAVGALIVKGGIGMGDVKLMLIMGLFQGFYGVISSLFCSLFIAFIYAVFALLLRRKTKKDSMAFAPAMLFGTILSVLLTGM